MRNRKRTASVSMRSISVEENEGFFLELYQRIFLPVSAEPDPSFR